MRTRNYSHRMNEQARGADMTVPAIVIQFEREPLRLSSILCHGDTDKETMQLQDLASVMLAALPERITPDTGFGRLGDVIATVMQRLRQVRSSQEDDQP